MQRLKLKTGPSEYIQDAPHEKKIKKTRFSIIRPPGVPSPKPNPLMGPVGSLYSTKTLMCHWNGCSGALERLQGRCVRALRTVSWQTVWHTSQYIYAKGMLFLFIDTLELFALGIRRPPGLRCVSGNPRTVDN